MADVHIGLLAYGGQAHAWFSQGLLDLTRKLQSSRLDVRISWITGESHVGRGRNTALSEYLVETARPDKRSVFQFLDTDLMFNPHTLADHIRAVLDGEAPGGLTGGSYPTKRLHPRLLKQALQRGLEGEDLLKAAVVQTIRISGSGRNGELAQDTLVETLYTPRFSWVKLNYLPTGLMTIPSDVALRLQAAYEDRHYFTDGGAKQWDLFPTLLTEVAGKRVLLSEDYAFCHLAGQAGVERWFNYDLRAAHMGSFTYGEAT